MFSRRVLKYICFTVLLIVLAACSSANETGTEANEEDVGEEESKQSGGELKVGYSAQPTSLDPHITQEIAIVDIMRHVYEPLVTVDADYNVQPMLADSYEMSDDGKVYTFYLREGVHFHNGDEMKADDVTASMNKWMDSLGSRGQFDDAVFEVVDDYTVTLTLAEPLSTTLTALSYSGGGFAGIMPKETIENAGAEGVSEYIGTGPFQLAEWKQDHEVHLEKYPDYQSREEPTDGLAGKREALIDDLRFMFVPDASTRVAGIHTGEYDVIHSVPYDDIAHLEEDEHIETHVYPGTNYSVKFNQEEGLFKDKKARQAIAYALNMEDILQATVADEKYYTMDHNIMMEHQKTQWSSDVGKDIYNINDTETAKQMLEDVGYDGEEVILLTTRDTETFYNGAVVIKEQLDQIGMDVELAVYDWATFIDKLFDKDAYDFYMMGNVSGWDPTTNSYMSLPWTDNKELDELIAEFRSKPTLEEAKPLFDDIQAWYWDYIPTIKIGENSSVAAIQDTVSGFQYQDGYIFWNVTNDK